MRADLDIYDKDQKQTDVLVVYGFTITWMFV